MMNVKRRGIRREKGERNERRKWNGTRKKGRRDGEYGMVRLTIRGQISRG
jgi:hypothetical protein